MEAVIDVVEHMRKSHDRLIEEVSLVSQELVRVAVAWDELWCAGLEDASRTYLTEGKAPEAINILRPLHEMMLKKPETLHEEEFVRAYGLDFIEAWQYTKVRFPWFFTEFQALPEVWKCERLHSSLGHLPKSVQKNQQIQSFHTSAGKLFS